MKTLHISTHDIAGGAAIAAYRQHVSLRNSGISSQMLVKDKRTRDPDVIQLPRGKSKLGLMEKLRKRRFKSERRKSTKSVSKKLTYFSDDRVPGPNPLTDLPEADVLNLHWVANYLDYCRFFARLDHGQPLVWTLHDMATMTGGCHYAMDCNRFEENCGSCPLLGSTEQNDLTHHIHARKKSVFATLSAETTKIVTPSNWLAGEARRSTLLRKFDVEVIPYGLDTEVFKPRDRAMARNVLGLPPDDGVILFVADDVGDYRKGGDLLGSALLGLETTKAVTLVEVGASKGGTVAGAVSLGRIENTHLMSHVYSAADIFVLPTRADNLPNVLLEALACGVPCISFDVGGVPDVVRHGETGLLVAPEDVEGLRSAIKNLLEDKELRERMSARCREVAEREYAYVHGATRYSALYESLVAASKRVSAA